MTPLPAGLADPLHVLEPWPWFRALLLAVLALATWFLLRRIARRRATDDLQRTPPPLPIESESPFERAVAAIRRRAGDSGDYRRGCHELAALVRGHLERHYGSRVRTLTAREVAGTFGDIGWSRLLLLLSGLRFGRRKPVRSDLQTVCGLALEARARGFPEES